MAYEALMQRLAASLQNVESTPSGGYRSTCPSCGRDGFYVVPTIGSFRCNRCEWSGSLEELAEWVAAAEEPRRRFRFLTGDELMTRPPGEWYVPDIIPLGGYAALVGPPGSWKTFIALSLALASTTGRDWLGHEVQGGPAVYILGEGIWGLGQRLRTWLDYHSLECAGAFYCLPQALPMMDASEVLCFIKELAELPKLVVIDTLARSMVGGDENSAKDIGLFNANVDRIRSITGAAVMGLHHTNAGGDRERGSTAVRGAVDTLIKVAGDDGARILRCEKQKDAPGFSDIPLRLKPHLDSALITARIGVAVSGDELTPSGLETLKSLQACLLPDGLTASQWLNVAEAKERTFYEARKFLHDNGYVRADKVGRGAKYTLTGKGEDALLQDCNETASSLHCSEDAHYMQAGGGLRPPCSSEASAANARRLRS